MFPLNVIRADSWSARASGLLFRKKLENNEALWLQSCRAIHTFGMRYSISVYFLDESHRVLSFIPNLKPCRLAWNYQAISVLEMLSTNPFSAQQRTQEIETFLNYACAGVNSCDSKTET